MTILLAFLSRAWPYILAAALAGLVWWKADHWCNSACQAQSVKARTAEGKIRTLEAQIAEAQERATALALLWSSQVDKTEAANAAAAKIRAEAFAPIQQRASAIPRGAVVRLPDGAYSLFSAASAAANAGPTPRPAAIHSAPAGPVPSGPADIDAADLTAAWVTAAAAYSDAVGQWRACVNFYTGLQEAERGH